MPVVDLPPQGSMDRVAVGVAEVFVSLLVEFEASLQKSLSSEDPKERMHAQKLFIQLFDRVVSHREFRMKVNTVLKRLEAGSGELDASAVVKELVNAR